MPGVVGAVAYIGHTSKGKYISEGIPPAGNNA